MSDHSRSDDTATEYIADDLCLRGHDIASIDIADELATPGLALAIDVDYSEDVAYLLRTSGHRVTAANIRGALRRVGGRIVPDTSGEATALYLQQISRAVGGNPS